MLQRTVKEQLKRGLSTLPAPKNEYEIVVPDDEMETDADAAVGDADESGTCAKVEDQADIDARIEFERQKQSAFPSSSFSIFLFLPTSTRSPVGLNHFFFHLVDLLDSFLHSVAEISQVIFIAIIFLFLLILPSFYETRFYQKEFLALSDLLREFFYVSYFSVDPNVRLGLVFEILPSFIVLVSPRSSHFRSNFRRFFL